ncbi:MAG: hypothetical protein HY053_00395, partial [Proteobacteria bacterium]|nr:hypothetical protein [Pseudomonadota bacterium]
LAWAQENIHAVLQGNLDPKLMEGEAAPMLEAAATILKTMKKPFVFNLGHGLSPQAKLENVQALVEFVHQYGFEGAEVRRFDKAINSTPSNPRISEPFS